MKTYPDRSGEVFGENVDFPLSETVLLDEELTTIDDADLETSIIELKRQIDAHNTQLLRRIAEFHRRDLGRVRHLLTTIGWMKQALRLTSTAAARMLRTARSLRHMPQVADQAAAGRITPDGLQLLTQARRRHPEAFTAHQRVFAEIAQYLSTKELRVAIEHWEQQIDFPSAVERVRHQRERRRVSMSQTWEGMWHLDAVLDPETGATIDTAIRSIVDRENVAASRPGSDDRRHPWQRRADALGDIAHFWLQHSDEVGTSGGTKPHVNVTTTLSSLLGVKDELPTINGLAFDPDDAKRITCDAGVVRMLLDADGEPLNVSRRFRTVTPAIRRALDVRDGGCVWSGCDAPASWCDAHHLIHWADGGATSMDNMVLLCRTHHRAAHQEASTRPDGVPP